jgi:hypothetical protein
MLTDDEQSEAVVQGLAGTKCYGRLATCHGYYRKTDRTYGQLLRAVGVTSFRRDDQCEGYVCDTCGSIRG